MVEMAAGAVERAEPAAMQAVQVAHAALPLGSLAAAQGGVPEDAVMRVVARSAAVEMVVEEAGLVVGVGAAVAVAGMGGTRGAAGVASASCLVPAEAT